MSMKVYSLIYIIGGLLMGGGIIIATLSKKNYVYIISVLGMLLMCGNFILNFYGENNSMLNETDSSTSQIKEKDKVKTIEYIETLNKYQSKPIKYSELLKLDAFDQLKENFLIDNNINSTDEVIIILYKQTYNDLIKRNIWGIVQLNK